jgi:hypothetical protein
MLLYVAHGARRGEPTPRERETAGLVPAKERSVSKTFRHHHRRTCGPADWEPLVDGYRERWQWLLERAAALADDAKHELAAIDRVRGYVLDGSEDRPRVDDLILVLGIAISQLDHDLDFELPGELFTDKFPNWVGPTHRMSA